MRRWTKPKAPDGEWVIRRALLTSVCAAAGYAGGVALSIYILLPAFDAAVGGLTGGGGAWMTLAGIGGIGAGAEFSFPSEKIH